MIKKEAIERIGAGLLGLHSIKAPLQWIGIGLGILYWFLESLLDSFLFHQGSLAERMFSPDPNELWMRLLVISTLIIFSFYAQSLIEKRNMAEEEIRKINEDLDLRVIERTEQVEAVNKRLEAEIAEHKQAERRLLVQYAVSRILIESTTLNEADPKIIQAVCECVGWDLGILWIVDHKDNVLRCVEHWYSSSVNLSEFEAITRQFTFSKGVGLPGRIWASGKPEWIVNVVKDTNFPRMSYAAKAGLHGAFGFPIVSGGEFLGVIEFFSSEIRQADDELLQMFTAIGNQIWQFMERKRVEEALLISEEKFRALAEQSISGICLIQDGKFVYVNPRLAEILDFRQEEMLDLPVLDLVAEPDRDMVRENMRKRIIGEVSYLRYIFHALKKGGSEVPMEVHGSAMKYLGRPAIMATLLDITERRQAEEELEKSLSLLRATIESTADGILVVNDEGKMVDLNQRFIDMWRIPESIVSSKNDNQALAYVLDQLKDPEGFLTKVRELYSQPDAESFDLLEFKDGRVFERYSRPQLMGGKSVGRVWSFRDVTERKVSEEKIKHMAYHDTLTDLPNRALFFDRLHQAILAGQRENSPVALLILDLDGFKEINDTAGHHYGDLMLQAVGMRLRSIVRKSDTVARIGGDEFALLLPGTNMEGATLTAHKVLETIKTPFSLEGRVFNIGVSIGIALFPDHSEDSSLLMQKADMAMYRAKESGIGYALYVLGEGQG